MVSQSQPSVARAPISRADIEAEEPAAGRHTRGPWSLSPATCFVGGAVVPPGWTGISARNWDDLALVVTRISDEPFDYPEGVANARLIAEAPALVEDGWSLAVMSLQSARYGKDRDFRDAVDAMLDTCRRAKGERTFAEHEAERANASPPPTHEDTKL